MKSREIILVVVLLVLLGLSVWLGYVWFGSSKKVSYGEDSIQSRGFPKISAVVRQLFKGSESESAPTPLPTNGPKYVIPYGTKDGMERMLIMGRIVQWGEAFLEVETVSGENFGMLINDKVVRLRCLPMTVTMKDGTKKPTQSVYVDMTRDALKQSIV